MHTDNFMHFESLKNMICEHIEQNSLQWWDVACLHDTTPEGV